jgi:hypothetical protein
MSTMKPTIEALESRLNPSDLFTLVAQYSPSLQTGTIHRLTIDDTTGTIEAVEIVRENGVPVSPMGFQFEFDPTTGIVHALDDGVIDFEWIEPEPECPNDSIFWIIQTVVWDDMGGRPVWPWYFDGTGWRILVGDPLGGDILTLPRNPVRILASPDPLGGDIITVP